MTSPEDDPMIAEIREYRDKQAARFGYDAAAIIRHARAMHEASGRPSVQYPPRRLEETSAPERTSEPQSEETETTRRLRPVATAASR